MIRVSRYLINRFPSFSSAKPPAPLSPAQFKALSQKHTILDVRFDFNDGLIKGAYWLYQGIADGRFFPSWLAVAIKPEQSYLIYAEKGEWQKSAKLFAERGYPNMVGYNDFATSEYKGETVSLMLTHFEDLPNIKGYTFLDVRQAYEWKQLGVIKGAVLLPLPELEQNIDEVKKIKGKILIHCALAYRARFAWSILQRHGIDDSYVFDQNFADFEANGLPIVPYEPKEQK